VAIGDLYTEKKKKLSDIRRGVVAYGVKWIEGGATSYVESHYNQAND